MKIFNSKGKNQKGKVVNGQWSVVSVLVGVLVCLFTVHSSHITVRAQSNEFTYQGRLLDNNLPPTANYDFEFSLWNSLVAGTQQGTTQTVTGVAVANGIFTVRLNFGAQFSGGPRFLEIHVRPGGGGAYTTLAPRQQITSSPYSIRSSNAGNADALSAACSLCVTDAQISGLDGSKVTGAVASAQNAVFSQNSVNAVNAVNAQNANNLGGIAANNYLQVNGDGSQLTNVSAAMKWNVILTDQQAMPNQRYVLKSPNYLIITLPTNPQIGDSVRFAGAGTGEWTLFSQTGQTIVPGMASSPWVPQGSLGLWQSIASSDDGNKLVAVHNGEQIYTSTDSGITWTARESNRSWESVASSADGSKLVAVVNNGQIYTSTDSGVSWTARESNRDWYSVASSADGSKLVAVDNGGQIYTSTDSGVLWTARESNRYWQSVASSADGSKLVAVELGGQIHTSTDSGVSWTARESNRVWQSVASSANGNKLVAVVSGGEIYTSTNSGVSWTPRASNRAWQSVASSADGSKLVAVVSGGQIYTSTNSGVSWTAQASGNRFWQSVASSADGSKLVAGVYGGQIYVSNSAFQWFGGTDNMVELVYIGGGQFFVVNQR